MKTKTPSYTEAQELISREGGYVGMKSLAARNRYAADELGSSLSLNPKYLYERAMEKSIDLQIVLKAVDQEEKITARVDIGLDLMQELAA